MANYHTQFSEQIGNLTDAEIDWLDTIDVAQVLKGEESFDFEYEIEGKPGTKGRTLWIYTEEGGNIEQVGEFMRQFLAAFRPTDYFYMTFAETCDKPRVGAFTGGALFVTALGYELHSCWEWVEAQKRTFAKAMRDQRNEGSRARMSRKCNAGVY